MGNNHDKFFSKDKRRFLVLGLENSGKTTIIYKLKTE
jgi:GTPase SAR1 family protein